MSEVEYDYRSYRYAALLCFLVGIFIIVIVPIVNGMPTKAILSGIEYYVSIGICAGLGVIFFITGVLVHRIYKQKKEQVAE
jgi:uncharacterized membrane protein